MDVFFKIIYEQVGYGCNTALRLCGVGFTEARFAAESDTVFLLTRHFQRETHTGYTSADNEEIVFLYHEIIWFGMQNYCIFTK